MRKNIPEVLILSVLLFVICLFVSCQENSGDDSDDNDAIDDSDDTTDDDDTADDGDDDYTDPDCLENIYPELISIAPFINGDPVDFPFTAYDTDEITFAFEYDDPDCNLIEGDNGGGIDFWQEDGIYGIGRFPEGTPCSTIDTGYPTVMIMDLMDELGNGNHQGWTHIYDKCGSGNGLYLEFVLLFSNG